MKWARNADQTGREVPQLSGEVADDVQPPAQAALPVVRNGLAGLRHDLQRPVRAGDLMVGQRDEVAQAEQSVWVSTR